MARATTVAQVIAGEAVSGTHQERWDDMVAIASAIQNRANLLGVTPQEVIANTVEFNAYNTPMPAGVGKNLVGLAQAAMDYVQEFGPTHKGTFYATPERVKGLPDDLSFETETAGHQYFSDPHNRAIRTAVGLRTPNQYAYAQNPANVPTPTLADAEMPATNLTADVVERQPGHWGLNPDVAPVPIETFNQWDAMASAPPVQAPVSQGFLSQPANLGSFPSAMTTQRELAAAQIGDGFSDLANAGPMGGDYASPADRMGLPSLSLEGSNEDAAGSRMDGFAPQVTSVDFSRFTNAVPGKTSRIGTTQALEDAARMNPLSGAIDPMTNTAGFLDQNRGTGVNSTEHLEVQRMAEEALKNAQQMPAPAAATTAGFLNNPALATPNFNQALNPTVPSLSVPSVTAGGFLNQPAATAQIAAAPQVTPTATAAQQVAGYQQMAQSATNSGLLNLSGGNLQDISLSGDVIPTAPYTPTNTLDDETAAPDLETISVPDQPTIAGPATTTDQQQTAPSRVTRTMPAAKTTPSFANKLAAAINPGTAIGAAIGGGFLGIPGAAIGGFLGNAVNQGGFLNKPMSINNVGPSPDTVRSIWAGGQPVGTQAVASDGQTVTSMPGGYTAITGKSGVTTVFDNNGKAMSYHGTALGNDEDAETASSNSGGGFFGGLFG